MRVRLCVALWAIAAAAGALPATAPATPRVAPAVRHDISSPLRTLHGRTTFTVTHAYPPLPLPRAGGGQGGTATPSALSAPTVQSPTSVLNFAGMGNGFSGPSGTFSVTADPSDAVGDVGPNNYVQMVNSAITVFNKSGTALLGPIPTNSIWAGFGGGCQTNNDGDATVRYDPMADRWVLSQPSMSTTPFLECVAVSTTPDPTGSYYRYAFDLGSTEFPDYPKVSVWPDGYYLTFNRFGNRGLTYDGVGSCALERQRMVLGQTARDICFTTGTSDFGLLAADLDGRTPPPAGAQNVQVGFSSTGSDLSVFRFHADWTTPANSTFTGPTHLTPAAFTELCSSGVGCIPQAGTSTRLQSLGDRLMFPLAYRNFGDHESLVVTHAVATGTGSGIRWYELRLSPGGAPFIYQQGTYAPDGSFRWMSSAAQDGAGDIALGYSVSSATIHPQIHYTARLTGDPPGTMTQGENTIIDGTGSQTGHPNWGDYTGMAVDPSDDATFWYTNQYIRSDGDFNWSTRIAAFRLARPDFSVNANPAALTVAQGSSGTTTISTSITTGGAQTVALSAGGLPAGVTATFSPTTVAAGGSSTLTLAAGATTPPGSYPVTVTATGSSATHSTTVTLTVTGITTVALASDHNPSSLGQAVTFTATVTGSGGTPAGTVTFRDGTASLGTATLSGGRATFTTSTLAVGSHAITAVYGGGGGYLGATSPVLTQVVGRIVTTLTARNILLGTVAATLVRADTNAPLPGMSIAFTVPNQPTCTANTDSSGVASCPRLYLPAVLAGRYTATFAGTPAYAPSSDTAGLTG